MLPPPPTSTLFPYTTLFRSFHPTEEYVALEVSDAIYIVAEKLAKDVAEKCGFPDAKTIARFPGNVMEHTWKPHFSRSEEHTSELQSRPHLVCRLLLEKKKTK